MEANDDRVTGLGALAGIERRAPDGFAVRADACVACAGATYVRGRAAARAWSAAPSPPPPSSPTPSPWASRLGICTEYGR